MNEQAVTARVLHHVLHRLNEFLGTREEDGEVDPAKIAREFFEWLAKQDAAL